MSIPPDFLTQIKARHTLSLVIGSRVKLKRQGRHFSGLCPFHKEKTPSFTVHDGEGRYHCFGCGVHGDVISYVQETEHLTFMETIEKLASQVGLEMPKLTRRDGSLQSAPRKDLFSLLEEATVFFQTTLKSARGKAIQTYLTERGVTGAQQTLFRLGYASDGNVLKTYLLQKGYTEKSLLEAGLVSCPEGQSQTYDRFRDRLMFPIWDRQGRVVAFGGRACGQNEPKYLNSPETPLFHKGSLLYGHHFARKPAHSAQRVLLCEGYMDVIALQRVGIAEAVAPLGTALTESQLALLWQLYPKPYVCFDGDVAGQKAAWRTVERILPHLKAGHTLQFVLMPSGEDPDSYLKAHSREDFEELLTQAIPLDQMVWQHFLATNPLKTPEDRAQLEKDLMETAQTIGDSVLRHNYRQTFRSRLFEHFRPQFHKNFQKKSQISAFSLKSSSRSSAPFTVALDATRSKYDALSIQHKILCAGILNHPALLNDCETLFSTLNLQGSFKILREHILLFCTDKTGLNSCLLMKYLYDNGFAEILDQLLTEDLYRHATFVRPDALYPDVQQGWQEIYSHVQDHKKTQDMHNQPLKPTQHSLSPLLRAMMKRDTTRD